MYLCWGDPSSLPIQYAQKPQDPILVVVTKLPTPMADILQLLANLSEFSPGLSVLLQHLTHSLFASTPSHLQGCQTLLVVGKGIQCPHQDMHINSLSLSLLANFTSYRGHQHH